MRKLRILIVGTNSNYGGIENQVHAWWEELKDSDLLFDFLRMGEEPLAFEEEYCESGSRILPVPVRKTDPSGSKREVFRIIREGGYDFMHFHIMSWSWAEPFLACRNTSTKPIAHSHTSVIKNSLGLKTGLLHKLGQSRTKNIPMLYLACGNTAGETMFGNRSFQIIENGIRQDRFCFSQEKRSRIRDRYGISEDQPVIGHVGHAGSAKNYPFLLESFRCLLEKNRDARLLMAGNMDKDPEILQRIRELRMEKEVILTGMLDDTADLFSAMDLFYLPSIFEGFPITLIEAQTAGLPCVASCFVPEESNVGGLVTYIPLKDPREAAAILRQKLEESHTRANPVPAAYDVKTSAEKLKSFYMEHSGGRE